MRTESPGLAISVIICSHNSRPDYLAQTLDGLARQSLDRDMWELVVVDNRSRPPLSEQIDLGALPHARLIREEKLGLTAARLTGIRNSRGELLVFVDDDNVLDADYLSQSLQISRERPFLGSWSGQCRPAFETQPAEWTRRYWGNLVIREFDRDVWSNMPRLPESMPCGAGLCVRREVALHYLDLHDSGRRTVQLDRTGDSLASGGDNDLAACACDLGLGVGLVHSLKLTHLIPPERLTERYLSRLAEGIYSSAAQLDWQRGIPVRRRSLPRRLADFVSAVRAGKPHRAILRAAHRGHDNAVRALEEMNVSSTKTVNDVSQ